MTNADLTRFQPFAVAQELFFKLMKRRIDLREAEPVVVELYASGEPTDEDDDNVAGVYLMEIDHNIPANKIADAALDAFHCTIPVACLDDFSFVVTRCNAVLAQDPDHIPGTFSQRAVLVNKVLG